MSKKDTAADIRPSVRMEELLREAGTQPFVTFDLYPLAEVRDQCIRTLEEEGNWCSGYYLPADTESVSGWVERRIYVLRLLDDPLWKKLLDWYVYHSGTYGRGRFDEETAVLAIEFAIALAQRERLGRAEAVHAVSSRLRRDSSLYWYAPSMKSFLAWLLSTDATGKNSATEWCTGWASAETAIRRIVEAEDIAFLPRLESLAGVENWEVPGGSDPFGLAIQSAIIAHAVKTLREARDRQVPDLNAAVGVRLRKEANLLGSVVVRVDCPESITVGEEASIRVWFSATKAGESDELTKILPRLSVQVECEGFDFTGQPHLAFESGSNVTGMVIKLARRGSKRLWLMFVLKEEGWREKGKHGATEREELAKIAVYVSGK